MRRCALVIDASDVLIECVVARISWFISMTLRYAMPVVMHTS